MARFAYIETIAPDSWLHWTIRGDTGSCIRDYRYSDNFHTVKGGIEYTWYNFFNRPVRMFAEYMLNVDSDEGLRYIPGAYEESDDAGFLIGAQYGKKPKKVNDWYAKATYREIGVNSVIGGFADADSGGANVNSLMVHWAYMWEKNCLLGVTFYLRKMNNAFLAAIPNNQQDSNSLYIDWVFKF